MNQDYVYCSDVSIGSLPNLFMVADGMGGHKAGEFASKCCVQSIVENVEHSSLKSPVSILEDAIAKANSTVLNISNSNKIVQLLSNTNISNCNKIVNFYYGDQAVELKKQ